MEFIATVASNRDSRFMENTMDKPTRYYSKRQEDKISKAVGGRRNANSGATKFSKGDVSTKKFLIEAKTATSEKSSFSIKKEWLKKNKEEAFAMNKPYSALCFDYGDNGERFYVIDEDLFKFLVDVIEKE